MAATAERFRFLKFGGGLYYHLLYTSAAVARIVKIFALSGTLAHIYKYLPGGGGG